MKIMLLPLLLFATQALALGAVPECWSSKDSALRDGVFNVQMNTAGRSARDVAELLQKLQAAFGTPSPSVSDAGLNVIETEISASIAEWRPSMVFPTRGSLKRAVIKSLEPVAALPGVTLACVKEMHVTPHPSVSAGN